MKPRQRRVVLVGLVLGGSALAVALVVNAFRSNLVFFVSPSDVLAEAVPRAQSFRLGGLVEAGSVARQPDGVTVHFMVTDTAQRVPVAYRGILPDLFREGKGVVALGRMEGGVFRAQEVLAKHDENYMPPEAADALARAGQAQRQTLARPSP